MNFFLNFLLTRRPTASTKYVPKQPESTKIRPNITDDRFEDMLGIAIANKDFANICTITRPWNIHVVYRMMSTTSARRVEADSPENS